MLVLDEGLGTGTGPEKEVPAGIVPFVGSMVLTGRIRPLTMANAVPFATGGEAVEDVALHGLH